MFTFHRLHSQPAEIWSIALAEGVAAGARRRLGKAVRFNARDRDAGLSHFHEVGVVVAFETANGDVEFIVACRDGLTEPEKRTLFVELEMLLGREVYRTGSEEVRGWFLVDSLGSFSGSGSAT